MIITPWENELRMFAASSASEEYFKRLTMLCERAHSLVLLDHIVVLVGVCPPKAR